MLSQRAKQGMLLYSLLAVALILACGTSTTGGNNPVGTGAVSSSSAQDLEARIKSAHVLVFENTWGLNDALTQIVQIALDGMGMTNYTYTKSDNGTFIKELQSDTAYDLIIVDQEDKDITITGRFWDEINTRLTRDKTALIIEMWYLEQEASGPISKILEGCGVRYQNDLERDNSIYWWVPGHPIFNEPNVIDPLIHYSNYWKKNAGDRIRLTTEGGDATLLAGLSQASAKDEAVLATCYGGRMILQTFSDHDYSQPPHEPLVTGLWQNYIHYTLKNHFAATP